MRRWPIIVGILALPSLALAQGTDYSAGKTPAQLFSGDCSACHKTPRGLAKGRDARTLASFLREHYTSKTASAGALAAYLAGNPSPPGEAADSQGASRDAAKRGKGKKPDPAEVAREATKAAEEAAKAKIQAYATAGEAARPLESEPVPQVTVIPAEPPPAETAPESPVQSPAVEVAPAAETQPPAEDRPPATPPPG